MFFQSPTFTSSSFAPLLFFSIVSFIWSSQKLKSPNLLPKLLLPVREFSTLVFGLLFSFCFSTLVYGDYLKLLLVLRSFILVGVLLLVILWELGMLTDELDAEEERVGQIYWVLSEPLWLLKEIFRFLSFSFCPSVEDNKLSSSSFWYLLLVFGFLYLSLSLHDSMGYVFKPFVNLIFVSIDISPLNVLLVFFCC